MSTGKTLEGKNRQEGNATRIFRLRTRFGPQCTNRTRFSNSKGAISVSKMKFWKCPKNLAQ